MASKSSVNLVDSADKWNMVYITVTINENYYVSTLNDIMYKKALLKTAKCYKTS